MILTLTTKKRKMNVYRVASHPPFATQSAPSAIRQTQFRPGDKVHHATFGDGVVVSSKMIGEDEEVEIAFVGKGVKRLIARYAGFEEKEMIATAPTRLPLVTCLRQSDPSTRAQTPSPQNNPRGECFRSARARANRASRNPR